jgi:hypothetical protein
MRRAAAVTLGLALAAIAAWIGCSSSSSGPADTPPDASSDAPAADAPAADVLTDSATTPSDAGPVFDAWGTPCVDASQYMCADFDTDAGFHYFALHATDGGTWSIEPPPAGVTAPSAPFVAVARIAPGAEALAQVHEGDAVDGMHCAVAMMLVQRGKDVVAPIALRLGNPSGPPPFYQLELSLGGDAGDQVREYGLLPDAATLPVYATPTPIAVGQWFEVSFDMAIGPTPVLSASINGVRVLDRPHNDLTGFDKPNHQMLTLGVVVGDVDAPWSFLFDNTICERLP